MTRTLRYRKMRPSSWFSIRLLMETGLKAGISKLVGPHSARRETLAALDQLARTPQSISPRLTEQGYFDYRTDDTGQAWPSDQEFWFDYVADLGDGFAATHSVAWLIGRDAVSVGLPEFESDPARMPSLTFDDDTETSDKTKSIPKGGLRQPQCRFAQKEGWLKDHPEHAEVEPEEWDRDLPAGELLIMGGDQVYPYASARNYRNRTVDPYYLARPWENTDAIDDERCGARDLYAIPGNHDWYDGLSSFVPNFCQPKRWMGVWRLQQRRSYFSLRLPHGYWLWGVDMATNDEFDAEQLNFFQHQAQLIGDDEQLILCVPNPAWLSQVPNEPNEPDQEADEDPWNPWRKIELLIRSVEAAEGVLKVPLIISGDKHYYARHSTQDEQRHCVVWGGGGAFMLGTDSVPQTLDLGDSGKMQLKKAFPDKTQSANMARRSFLGIVTRHPRFCFALAAVLFGFYWTLYAGSRDVMGAAIGSSAHVFTEFVQRLVHSPVAAAYFLVLIIGFVLFTGSSRPDSRTRAATVGAASVHLLSHLCVAAIVLAVTDNVIQSANASFRASVVLYLLAYFIAAVPLHGIVVGAYLYFSNRLLGFHQQEVFSSQSIQDYKGFLRFSLAPHGLTLHALGVEKVEKTWKPVIPGDGSDSSRDKPRTAPETDVAWGRVGRSLNDVFEGGKSDVAVIAPGDTHALYPKRPLKVRLLDQVRIPVLRRMSDAPQIAHVNASSQSDELVQHHRNESNASADDVTP